MIHGTQDHGSSVRQKFIDYLLLLNVVLFFIHTPYRPVSAAARQLSCVCKFHPNSSPVFVAHYDQSTGLEL